MKVVLLFLSLISIVFSVHAENISNDHPSPYVRLHANDAVKWQQWDASVLQRAQKENKLIMISSGYYACHWCHVMREESFKDVVVAEFLNTNFIAVKIDRELNSSLDAYLMNFLQQTQGYGGWPLNVFITPDGYPLTGMVYFPKNKFLDVIKKLNKKWQAESDQLKSAAAEVFDYTQQINNRLVSVTGESLREALRQAVMQSMDELEGGFGNRVKFPLPELMLSLLKIHDEKPDENLAEFIKLSLHQMVKKGLHDVIGGGFYRYTVDQSWQVPHFEKMLYTNAAMIKLYIKAYQVFDDKRWLKVAEETMDFVVREMAGETGGYVSALNSQDMSKQEGGNYIWDKKDLFASLTDSQQAWLTAHTELVEVADSGKVLPVGLWQSAESAKIKKILLQKRINNPPLKDNKLVISWNAYLLSAMIDLLHVSKNESYEASANALYKVLKQRAKSGLVRSKKSNPQRFLEDYAFVAMALWQWNEWRGDAKDAALIQSLLIESAELFVTKSGWKETDASLIPLPGVQRNLKDANIPSAEVVLLGLMHSMRLPDTIIKRKIQALPQQLDMRLMLNPLDYSSYITMEPVR